jgi:hypothetical protein
VGLGRESQDECGQHFCTVMGDDNRGDGVTSLLRSR